MRLAASGIDTASSISIARFIASAWPMPRCLTSTSVNWVETRRNGLSEVIGSWKIIDMEAPRSLSSSSSFMPRISCPRSLTLPEPEPFLASRPMIVIRIWLLPEPDSPTMPTTSPALRAKLTPLTAATLPLSVRNSTLRSLTSRIVPLGRIPAAGRSAIFVVAISAVLRIESVAQPVGDEIEAEQGRGQEQAWDDQLPGRRVHRLGAAVDQRAPARLRLLDAEAEVGEEGFAEDHLRDEQAGIDDDRPDRVRDDVLPHDRERPHAAGARRLDEFLVLQAQGLAAHDHGDGQPQERADRDQNRFDAAAQHHGQHDDEEQERQAVEHVDDAHHDRVDGTAEEAGDGTVADADDDRDDGREHADQQRRPAALEHAREQVAAEIVGAEDVPAREGRRNRDAVEIRLVGIERQHEWPEGAGQHDQGEHDQADHGHLVPAHAAETVLELGTTGDGGAMVGLVDEFKRGVTHSAPSGRPANTSGRRSDWR